MKKIKLLAIFFLITCSLYSQKVQLTGTQTQKQNTELKCSPVSIHKSMVITKIEGDCEGFWIVKNDKTIHKFTNNKSALGTTLTSGKYYIYPFLKEGRKTASVTITLEPKTKE